ncbi:MAG: 16S rRNA (uracil(1498)-N(3))-methyltransferase [Prolixibacteraceae bacterium]|jgi:16S rRNA (uracil1498-N3)-methyltransferase|nr:16S rRNA (uracil(1498)-N(3))-methyltransferase [Prolixibacteraceae bacterium]
MNSFYIPDIKGTSIELNADESRHCIKVLRLTKGDYVQLLNGKGSIYNAVIQEPDPKRCLLGIMGEEKYQNSRDFRLTIAIAPTKNNERFEWFLEKSTEIGIDRIIPMVCQHSERKDIKSDRLEKILISAMKQSLQGFLPELASLTSFKALVNTTFEGVKLIAHCEPGEKNLLKNSVPPGKNILVLIGPEGDFDPSEIKLAIDKGFIPVSLGESRLRTETAGIVACHTFCMINQI